MSEPTAASSATGNPPIAAMRTVGTTPPSPLRKLARHARAVWNLGPINAVRYRKWKLGRGDRPFAVRSRLARYPLWLRPGTSDILVFRQIFVEREYQCLDDVRDPRLIIDCGANIGLASAYLLSRFPGARVIAIEPDPGNFDQLRQNLAPFGDRATAIRSAIWSHPANLFIDYAHGDGEAWSTRVLECREGQEPDLVATDIGTILAGSGASSISILKIDVEGAEGVIFGGSHQAWIDRVENMAIELHGDENASIFSRAIAPLPFAITHCGENIVCKRAARTGAR